jgi:diguanylate cyclase (GGDEF)-like protein
LTINNNSKNPLLRLTYQELTQLVFSKLHILQRVNKESVWGLLEYCAVEILAENTVLLTKGQSNHTMYMVLSGQLSVHLDNPDHDPVAFLGMGETVGEISVIDDSPASAYVKASSITRLLAIDESTFWRLVEVSHEFATNLLLLLASRLRDSNSTIVESFNQRLLLEHEATVDSLTGMRNRRWLDKNLLRMVKRYQFSKEPLCVVVLDIDFFKKFNDTYGHSAGDRVLTSVAHTVMDNLRPTDLAARYGGEEFCVMLPNTSLDGGITACNRIREAVKQTEVKCADGRTLPPVTISLGVACIVKKDNEESILKRADQALYKAKENGRNRVEGAD